MPPIAELPGVDARWDLTQVFASDANAAAELDRLAADAAAFAAAMPALDGVDGGELASLLEALDGLRQRSRRLTAFGDLRAAEDSTDGSARDLGSLLRQRMPEVENALRGFQLAWLTVTDERATALAAQPVVARDRYFLQASRRFAPHTLSAAEERALAARSGAAEGAWSRLWIDESTATRVVCDLGEGASEQTLSDLVASQWHPSARVRRTGHAALAEACDRLAPATARCLDAVVGDRLATDTLRGHREPMAATNLTNDLDTATVDAMLVAARQGSGILRRWLLLKARLLGHARLPVEDLSAPVGTPPQMAYPEAVERVVDAFRELAPEAGDTVEGIFLSARVDAAPRPGKMGGAFCQEIDRECEPYVLLNHTGQLTDVQVMAHELGHGLHLARCLRAQSAHSGMPSFALIEVPSTLAELMLVDNLLDGERDPARRLALQAGAIETAVQNVFMCSATAEWERGVYRMKAMGTALSVERLNTLWLEHNRQYLGDSSCGDEIVTRWSAYPHAVLYRFYMYAYAFSCLLALVLMRRRRHDPEAFAGRYLEFLDRGGSLPPAELLAPLGIELGNAALWDEALAELDRMVDEAAGEIPGSA